MATHKVSRTIDVDAPASVVFDIIAPPPRHSEIDGSGSVGGPTFGPDRLGPGARFGVDMRMFGVPYRMSNEVVEFEEGRLLVWKTKGPQRWGYELRALPDGGTRVRETFDYSRGPSFFYALTGFPRKNAEAIEQTLLRLREIAEAENRG
ncbi:SRPBCC family protein [Nocardiopsis salina]|uniref:SRPBCC family protein n=1 Tax=Nocardiopsis salina TaxID=245836 RepID=UPI00034A7A47|nr:SRPBCC family protein [Nocardiopsis salina]